MTRAKRRGTRDCAEAASAAADHRASRVPRARAVSGFSDGDVGGFAAPGGATTDIVERYDLWLDRWARVAPIPQAVNHAAAVGHDGDLYVVGGYTAAATVNGRIVVVVGGGETAGTIAKVESFDPRTRRWRSEPRLKTPRHGLGAISHRGRVVVLQGGPTPGLDPSDVTEALRVPR